ncbi:site-specific integrase [Lactobacillus helsingborgensis]|uniref:tyrosine-type recombinase/integrase n=1 Tax=Lactobacillus helsingborgensis TaxID=1218494 RepID=UPI0016504684|nr:site-specific integrase [Lactobacillus helsingborgensis]MBC6355769.1 site-specific integrase [Lactobacillus helsingborgensis]
MPKRDPHIKEYKNKRGERLFKFHLYLGLDANGKRVNITRQGFPSYNEAKTTYDQLRANGTQGYQKPKQIKTDEMYSLWFENYKGQVKESTANKTWQLYKNHIKPIFGNRFMDKIQVKAVQKFANQKAKEIVKYKDVVRLLSTLFEHAIRLGYVEQNPIRKIIMPNKTSRPRRDIEHNVYSKQELEEFLAAAKKYDITAYTYFKLLSSTGLRRSEALALSWKDIDLTKNTLSVNRTLAYGLNSKTIMQPPKSKMSKRILPISANLHETLINYKKSQKVIYKYLFHGANGKWCTLTKHAQWLNAIYKNNPNLRRITIHSFRHTFATLLISETNIKPKTVQMLMGHEDIKMTLDIYTHLNDQNKIDATNSIRELNI